MPADDEALTGPVDRLTPEQMKHFIAHPLNQLPQDWRLPVYDFWLFFSHLFPTELVICTRLRYWMDSDQLTLEELTEIMKRMRSPAVAAEYQFASQVLAGLGEQLQLLRAESRKKKQEAKEKAEKKKERERYEADRAKNGVLNFAEYIAKVAQEQTPCTPSS